MAFTQAQTDAMTASGRALLVSATAGAGKTYTLTHRIINKLLDDPKATLSRMLIVTFTRSAAGELKAKIAKALSEELEKNPSNPRLQKELINLGSAHISTIDSFFSAPVKANFEKLGLPASMKLADDAELSPIRDTIMNDVLDKFFKERSGINEEELSAVGHRNSYIDLLSLLTASRDSSGLVPSLTSFYYKLLSSPNGVNQLKISAQRMANSATEDFFDSEEGKIIKAHAASVVDYATIRLKKTLENVYETADRLLTVACDDVATQQATAIKIKVSESFGKDITNCCSLASRLSGNYSDAKDFIKDFKFDNYVSLKGNDKSEEADHFKNLRTKIVAPVKALSGSFFSYSEEDIARHFNSCADMCNTLADILLEFDRRYCAEKLARGICEFSDMPKFMLQLLQNPDGTPTALAESMAKDFDEVYIDEYQDVNAIQDRIFDLIGGSRRFMVGDIKQSIYGFRDAEPSIFAKYRKQFPQYDPNNTAVGISQGGNAIFMSENFRCDETVIDFSNEVCSEIFTAFAESIGYDDKNDRLKFAKEDKNSPNYKQPQKVKVMLVQPPSEAVDSNAEEIDPEAQIPASSSKPAEDDDVSKYADEATVVVNEIVRLIRDKQETNRDGSRIRPGDIAVLVRKKLLIPLITHALSKAGIKYASGAKTEVLEAGEMKTLVDLLTVIDNPRDDIPLCRVLTAELSESPIMTLSDVVGIRHTCDRSKSLYDALLAYADVGEDKALAEKCKGFTKTLTDFRLLSSRVSADKLLRAISRCDLFTNLCNSEAYTYLYVRACNYTKNAWNGLYAFLSYIKKLVEKGESSSEPVNAKEDEVTIITMHQSKGLEYKVCFLFGLSKEFNMQDLRAPLIFSRDLGLSAKLPAPHEEDLDIFGKAQKNREENLLWRSATLLIKDQLLEEEARVFYVALTRAKERLYLSATLSKSFDEELEEKYKSCYDITHEIKAGKSYITWTLLKLSQLGRHTEFYDIETFTKGSIPPLSTRITKEDIDSNAYGITELDKEFAAMINEPHGESDEEKLLSMIPAKVAASKASHSMLDESVFLTTPAGKHFSDSEEGASEQPSDTSEQIKNRIALMRSKKVDFDSLLEENKKPTAAEKGSAAHLILQHCDFDNLAANGLDSDIDRMVNDRFITKRTADIVDRKQLAGFFGSDLFTMIRNARQIKREFQFGMFRSADAFTQNESMKKLVSEKKIFVQGSIDLLIETKDGEIILCDYKTDKISTEEKADRELLVSNMRKKHKNQLDEYSFAVKEIFGKAPIKVYIYSIPLGEMLEL